MKPQPDTASLEKHRDRLLSALPLFSVRDDSIAPLLARIPLTPIAAPLPEAQSQFWQQLFNASPHAHHAMLLSEIDLLEASHEHLDDIVRVSYPFGFEETVWPVRAQGTVAGYIWTGKHRTKPFNKTDIKKCAEAWQLDEAETARLQELWRQEPDETYEMRMSLLQSLRDALQYSLQCQNKAHDLSEHAVLIERERSYGALSGGVAHHFNSLLSVILGYSSFLLNRTKMDPASEQALRQISEAAQKGRRLTEEIAALTSQTDATASCSLHEILSRVLSLLQTQTAGHVQMETHYEATNDTVRASRSQLHQIVFNLLTNAIDSMPGGGHLTVRTSNATLADDDDREMEHIRVEVIDSGITKESAEQARLSRLTNIVDQLEGTARISRDADDQNRAEVLLPLDVCAPEITTTPAQSKRLTPSVIWIVDDDPIFSEMCDRVLTDDGHAVETLASGPELMKRWDEIDKQPNLLIIDFSMPEYNGMELCVWLKEQKSSAPVILVSGLSPTHPDIHAALQMRKTYFLQKPFPVPELADIVSVALGETLLNDGESFDAPA